MSSQERQDNKNKPVGASEEFALRLSRESVDSAEYDLIITQMQTSLGDEDFKATLRLSNKLRNKISTPPELAEKTLTLKDIQNARTTSSMSFVLKNLMQMPEERRKALLAGQSTELNDFDYLLNELLKSNSTPIQIYEALKYSKVSSSSQTFKEYFDNFLAGEGPDNFLNLFQQAFLNHFRRGQGWNELYQINIFTQYSNEMKKILNMLFNNKSFSREDNQFLDSYRGFLGNLNSETLLANLLLSAISESIIKQVTLLERQPNYLNEVEEKVGVVLLAKIKDITKD